MSRIGKLPIGIPAGVKIDISKDNVVTVKGKFGELHQKIDPCVTVTTKDGNIVLERASEALDHKAKHGFIQVTDCQHGHRSF